MAIYDVPLPHERLDVFFGELFMRIRREKPTDFGEIFLEIEETFRKTGYRDENSSAVENILIVRLDAIGDMIVTSGFIREVRKNFPAARIKKFFPVDGGGLKDNRNAHGALVRRGRFTACRKFA